MIHSTKKWKDKESLREVLKNYSTSIYIEGATLSKGNYKRDGYSGYVSNIPYGITVIVKDGGKTYNFKKETDGTFTVF